jgi:hypothetical protein
VSHFVTPENLNGIVLGDSRDSLRANKLISLIITEVKQMVRWYDSILQQTARPYFTQDRGIAYFWIDLTLKAIHDFTTGPSLSSVL